MFEKFFDVVINNPVNSICIILAGIFLFCSGLKNIEFGPLKLSVENTSRRSIALFRYATTSIRPSFDC